MPFEAIAPWRELWVYLSATPLFSLTITLAVYLVWEWVHRRAPRYAPVGPDQGGGSAQLSAQCPSTQISRRATAMAVRTSSSTMSRVRTASSTTPSTR